MVDPAIVGGGVLLLALLVDRLVGDPQSPYHPVALLGRLIDVWGRPERWPARWHRPVGVVCAVATIALFTIPFILCAHLGPLLLLLAGPLFLKACFAWRALEEHAAAVERALSLDLQDARKKAGLLVSRDTAPLNDEQVRSAAYESVAENLVDSITAPLLYFSVLGLGGAAAYRAVNTMDAMLGYRDERLRLGWAAARLDDILGFIPARVTGVVLLTWFTAIGRGPQAWRTLRADRRKRPGFNGGIPMALIAGGVGVAFEKPGIYQIGTPEMTLAAGGPHIVRAVRAATIGTVVLCLITLFLWAALANRIQL